MREPFGGGFICGTRPPPQNFQARLNNPYKIQRLGTSETMTCHIGHKGEMLFNGKNDPWVYISRLSKPVMPSISASSLGSYTYPVSYHSNNRHPTVRFW